MIKLKVNLTVLVVSCLFVNPVQLSTTLAIPDLVTPGNNGKAVPLHQRQTQ